MAKFYFTYGSEGYAFKGGWTVVEAESLNQAIGAFRVCHGNEDEDCIPCAHYYTEGEFEHTKLREKGNLGAFEWERINFSRTIKDGTAR